MSLRRTAVCIICLTFAALFAVLYAISSNILQASFSALEREEVEEEVTRATRALAGEMQGLEATVADWGMWDDTYRFVAQRDPEFLRLNVNFQSLETLRADLLLIYDAGGTLVLGRMRDAAAQELTAVPQALADQAAAMRRLVDGEKDRTASGILVAGEDIWLLAACPILTSVREGPARGTLLMGRRLDTAAVARLSELIMLDLGVVNLQAPGVTPRFADVAAALGRAGRPLLVPEGDARVKGFALLRDWAGRPAMLLSATMERRIFAQERIAQRNNVVFLLVAGLAFGLAMLYLLEQRILSRVSRLRGQISELGAASSGQRRTFIAGNDEIAALSKAINAMLAALDQAHGRYAMATRAARVGVWELWKDSGAYYVDPEFLALLGYDAEAGMPPGLDAWLAHVHPEDRERVRSELAAWAAGDAQEYVGEQRMLARDGGVRWILVRGKAVRDASGRVTRFVGTNTDVTELKQAEESVRELTGALIKAQEKERARIARDLHDNVAQDLSAAKIASQTLLDGVILPAPAVEGRFNALTEMLSRAIRAVREISYDLRPPDLEYLGLVQALQGLCDDFARTSGLPVDFAASGMEGVAVPQDVAINVYRVAQEALANVRRHAGARQATVRLVESYPRLILRVKDDGRGFDVAEGLARAGRTRRMGLASMRERVGLFGGTLRIVSEPGKGCLLAAEVVYAGEARHGNETDTDR
jgi:PAS domain S-box-containing protein